MYLKQENLSQSKEIVAIGDCMVVMNPQKQGSLKQVQTFEKGWAGAEANFLAGCSRLGIKTGFISALACDPFGATIYKELLSEGIDLSLVQRDDQRATPLYFKEYNNTDDISVYYYRTNTAGSYLDFDLINFDYFNHTKLFFYTSIFPALSKDNRSLLQRLLPKLKEKGILLCFDPNIRQKLFQNTADIKELILPMLDLIDILIISNNEAKILFGTDEEEKFFKIIEQYNIPHVVMKQGAAGSCGLSHQSIVFQKTVATQVIDVCGAGDAFNAGYIYGYLNNFSVKKSLEYAAYTASFAVSSASDNQNAPSLEELENKIQNKTIINR